MLKNSDVNHANDAAYWCVVSGSALWMPDGTLPQGNGKQLGLPVDQALKISEYQGKPVMLLHESQLETVLEMTSLREFLHLPEEQFLLLSKAVQYGHMLQTMRFCPICGGRNHINHRELAMQCNDCRTVHYPRIFPCIIVAVRKDNQILLAQHNRHKGGLYTVIAGFVEAGETLEQCVRREVKEETGIEVTNIRYFGSQPWAFPSSMMVAFMADYQSGEVTPDHSELGDAKWCSAEEIPLVAPQGTIARALIEQTLQDIRTGQ